MGESNQSIEDVKETDVQETDVKDNDVLDEADKKDNVSESDAEDKKSDGEKTDDADDADDGASSYADAIELPGGLELDKELLSEVEPILKEAGVTTEQAQQLAEILAKREQANAQAQQDYIEQQLNEWREQAETDKEYGGDQFEENLGLIRDFVSKYATDEFKDVLEETGLGNHPEMVRFMYRIAKATKEDQPINGEPPSPRMSKEQERLRLYKN